MKKSLLDQGSVTSRAARPISRTHSSGCGANSANAKRPRRVPALLTVRFVSGATMRSLISERSSSWGFEVQHSALNWSRSFVRAAVDVTSRLAWAKQLLTERKAPASARVARLYNCTKLSVSQ